MQVGDKEYSIKRKLTVSEVREIRKAGAAILRINERLAETPDEVAKVQQEIFARTDEQDQLVISILARCLEKTEADLAEMDYLEALMLFSKLYEESTILKKT